MDTPLQDWGILLYNQSRREKREAKQGTKMASPRQDNTLETATPGGSVVTTVIRSDDEIPASGTPRRQKLSLRRNESGIRKHRLRAALHPIVKLKRLLAMTQTIATCGRTQLTPRKLLNTQRVRRTALKLSPRSVAAMRPWRQRFWTPLKTLPRGSSLESRLVSGGHAYWNP